MSLRESLATFWENREDLASRQLPRGLVTTFLRHLFTERFTPTGNLLFWCLLLSGGTGAMTLVMQIYVVFCLLASVSLLSIVLARLARPKLSVRAELPSHTTCGARLTLPIHVSNVGTRPAWDVIIRDWRPPREVHVTPWEGNHLPTLAPGEQCVVQREFEFTRRGHYEWQGVRQETVFPWGLWKDLVDHPHARSILVYPFFHPLVHLDLPVGKRYQPGGIALSSNVGDSIEFIGTREYRQGDNPRAIHWRTWARLGQPAVKEFQEEYFCRIALLMDTFIPARETKRRREGFEAAISLAASVADCLSREEYIIDIFAAGPEIYYLQCGRSLAYLENVLDILACLEPCAEEPFEKIAPILAENLDNITTVVVVLLDWDERRERLVRSILDHGSAVKIVVVRDGPCTADVGAAGDLSQHVAVVDSRQVKNGIEEL